MTTEKSTSSDAGSGHAGPLRKGWADEMLALRAPESAGAARAAGPLARAPRRPPAPTAASGDRAANGSRRATRLSLRGESVD